MQSTIPWRAAVVALVASAGVTLGAAGAVAAEPSYGEHPAEPAPPGEAGPAASSYGEFQEFIEAVASDVNQVWYEIFAYDGLPYETPTVWFTGGKKTHQSACPRPPSGDPHNDVGKVSPAFYCEEDQTVYLSLSWLADTARDYGDFAPAAVVAHEFGHHVQHLASQLAGKPGCCRSELQADCLAGVWAYTAYARDMLDDSDIEEALALQWDSGANQHGSGEERYRWFHYGFDSGFGSSCDA